MPTAAQNAAARKRAEANRRLNNRLMAQGRAQDALAANPTYINGVPQAGRANPNSNTAMVFGGAAGKGWRDYLRGVGPNPNAGPGFDPDAGYRQQQAAFDSYIAQMRSSMDADRVAERASTKAALQQALIGFGLVPEGFKDELGALDPTTIALIKKNTETGISGIARMNEKAMDIQKATLNRLASKGLRRSGAKGYKLRRGQLDKDREYQDAISALLAEAGGRYAGLAGSERGRQQSLIQMLYQSPSNSYVSQGQGSTAPTYTSPTTSSPTTSSPTTSGTPSGWVTRGTGDNQQWRPAGGGHWMS